MSGRARGWPLADVGRPTDRRAWCVFGVVALCLVVGVALSLCIATGPGPVGSALGLAARFRRSRGQERLQLKWLVGSGS